MHGPRKNALLLVLRGLLLLDISQGYSATMYSWTRVIQRLAKGGTGMGGGGGAGDGRDGGMWGGGRVETDLGILGFEVVQERVRNEAAVAPLPRALLVPLEHPAPPHRELGHLGRRSRGRALLNKKKKKKDASAEGTNAGQKACEHEHTQHTQPRVMPDGLILAYDTYWT